MQLLKQRTAVVLLSAAGLCLILALVSWLGDVRTQTQEAMLIPTHRLGIGRLQADQEARQTFRTPSGGLTAVNVMFSNYNRNGKIKSGELVLRLTDESGAELASGRYACAPLRNTAMLTLPLTGGRTVPAGALLTLWASATVTDAEGVSLRMGPKGADSSALELTLANGSADADNALYMTMVFESRSHGWMAAFTFVLIAACFAAGLLLLPERRKPNAS